MECRTEIGRITCEVAAGVVAEQGLTAQGACPWGEIRRSSAAMWADKAEDVPDVAVKQSNHQQGDQPSVQDHRLRLGSGLLAGQELMCHDYKASGKRNHVEAKGFQTCARLPCL